MVRLDPVVSGGVVEMGSAGFKTTSHQVEC